MKDANYDENDCHEPGNPATCLPGVLQNQLCVFVTRSTEDQRDGDDQGKVVQQVTGSDGKHLVLPGKVCKREVASSETSETTLLSRCFLCFLARWFIFVIGLFFSTADRNRQWASVGIINDKNIK